MTYLGMMPLASLRIEKELLDEAKELGLNVSEAAREGIRNAIRKKRMLDNLDWLEKNAVKPPPGTPPSEVLVRQMRDERSAQIDSWIGRKARKEGKPDS